MSHPPLHGTKLEHGNLGCSNKRRFLFKPFVIRVSLAIISLFFYQILALFCDVRLDQRLQNWLLVVLQPSTNDNACIKARIEETGMLKEKVTSFEMEMANTKARAVAKRKAKKEKAKQAIKAKSEAVEEEHILELLKSQETINAELRAMITKQDTINKALQADISDQRVIVTKQSVEIMALQVDVAEQKAINKVLQATNMELRDKVALLKVALDQLARVTAELADMCDLLILNDKTIPDLPNYIAEKLASVSDRPSFAIIESSIRPILFLGIAPRRTNVSSEITARKLAVGLALDGSVVPTCKLLSPVHTFASPAYTVSSSWQEDIEGERERLARKRRLVRRRQVDRERAKTGFVQVDWEGHKQCLDVVRRRFIRTDAQITALGAPVHALERLGEFANVERGAGVIELDAERFEFPRGIDVRGMGEESRERGHIRTEVKQIGKDIHFGRDMGWPTDEKEGYVGPKKYLRRETLESTRFDIRQQGPRTTLTRVYGKPDSRAHLKMDHTYQLFHTFLVMNYAGTLTRSFAFLIDIPLFYIWVFSLRVKYQITMTGTAVWSDCTALELCTISGAVEA
ncbi:hypothetical protein BU15DRAFT_67562 [Melanogaster broomeanus]|nr:hypothetical protein BU15DRAFT_67562 [Melanogaster broomeanus]